jgi:hypothetical protein
MIGGGRDQPGLPPRTEKPGEIVGVDELRRGLAGGPGLGVAGFMPVRQTADLVAGPIRLVVHDQLPVYMRDHVVPGRHHAMVLRWSGTTTASRMHRARGR